MGDPCSLVLDQYFPGQQEIFGLRPWSKSNIVMLISVYKSVPISLRQNELFCLMLLLIILFEF